MMTPNVQGIDRVAVSVRDAVERYADILLTLLGEDLASLTLYGPVLNASFDRSRHTVRNVVVLRQINLEVLRELAQHGTRLAKSRIAAPIVMPPSHVHESLDTFPLELLEIQQHHATLLGEDFFQSLDFEPDQMRLQCERELKVLLVGMRQGLLASGGHAKQLGRLEESAAETLLRILQGLLWLKEERDTMEPLELITRAESVLQRGLPAVRLVTASADGRGWEQFVSLYGDLEALREVIDAL